MQNIYEGIAVLRPVEGSGDESEVLTGPRYIMATSLVEAKNVMTYSIPLSYINDRHRIDIFVREFRGE